MDVDTLRLIARFPDERQASALIDTLRKALLKSYRIDTL